jgi:hypothetical protein
MFLHGERMFEGGVAPGSGLAPGMARFTAVDAFV